MVRPGLFTASFVLAATALTAQTPAAKPQTQKPTPPASTTPTTKAPDPQAKSSTPYVPAIMQQRMATLSGCLQQQKQDFVLTDVKVSQQGDVAQGTQSGATTYKIEGLSRARLSVLVGKRVDVTGAFQGDPKRAPAASALPRFEATNMSETAGADAKPCS